MSRVFRALEKAEEEKRQKREAEPAFKAFEEIVEEKVVLKKETPVLKIPEEKEGTFALPPEEESPVQIAQAYSFAGEEFRKLKTQIFHRLPNPPHSVLITSATPGEGKTMISVNLALAISQEIQKRAILIDCDLRKPGIRFDKGENQKGLSNYLSDGTPLSEILIKSGVENLQIIQAGPPAKKSSELIGSKRMRELMKSVSDIGESTYIIIDSSPVISTTEPVLLSKMVDGIILVVMAGRSPKEAIRRTIKSLGKDKIIGVVLNQIDLKTPHYYSKYYYRYYRK